MIHQNLTGQIIRAFFTVYNELGYGFLEKVHENALYLELRNSGLTVVRQMPIDVFYHKTKVGTYYADLCVEEKVIIELKAAEGINKEQEHQLLNYLKAIRIEVGLLLNFGTKPELKKIFEHRFKNPFISFPSV